MRHRKATSTLLLAAIVGMTGCTVEGEDPKLVEARGHERACAEELAAGNYTGAIAEAEKVVAVPAMLAIDDVTIDRVRFCFTSAATLKQFNEITTELQFLLETGLKLIEGGSLSPADVDALRLAFIDGRFQTHGPSPIGAVITSLFDPIRNRLANNRQHLEAIIKNNRFTWTIQRLPVTVADHELLNAGGRYDMGEVHLLYGLTRAILSIFEAVESIDYNFNLNYLIEYAGVETDAAPLRRFSSHPVSAVLNLGAVLLSTDPRFLSLDAATGRDRMARAGEGFSILFGSLLNSLNHMAKRSGDQSDFLLEYRVDDNTAYLVFHGEFISNPIPIVDIAKFGGLAIPLKPEVFQSFEKLRDSLAGVLGERANLQRDIFPLVALGIAVSLSSGAFDALINTALSSSDPAAAARITELLAIVSSNSDFILGALVSLVPVTVELDLGHMFKNPVNPRDVLPAWIQPARSLERPYTLPLTAATFVLSYECEDGLNPLQKTPEAYFCSATQDRGHFDDIGSDPENVSIYHNFGELWAGPISADGIAVVIPYIGFKDPSFGGVLYLDMTAIANPGFIEAHDPTESMPLATQKTLNATLASIFVSVGSLLNF
jgi:hypothetical protein